MTDWAIITGASSGIGRCLALELCRRGVPVLGIGRRRPALEATGALVAAAGATGFRFTAADIGTESGRRDIVAALGPGGRVRYLAQLAAVFPVERFEKITPVTWRETFAANVEGRIFLAQALAEHFIPGARMLFAKSGMSQTARVGCIQIAASMGASLMVERCLKLELRPKGVLVSSTKPGFVLTEMMVEALKTPPEILPDVIGFRAAPMIAPEVCARYLAWLLRDTDDEAYVREDWDIADIRHHPDWLGAGPLYITAGGPAP